MPRTNWARRSRARTLQATALVHEAYLRLVGDGKEQSWDSRGHFFAAAAEGGEMRDHSLVEHVRQGSLKQGGDRAGRHWTELQLDDTRTGSEDLPALSTRP